MSKKLKIGVVCYPTYGGSGVIATELGSFLAKEGHELHFITSSAPVKLDLFAHNIYFHEVSIKKYPLFKYEPYEVALTSKIVDIVLHEGLDLLHVHYAIPHASAAIMAKSILASQGVYLPIVTTLHGTDITLVGKDPAYAPVIKYSIENSDIVTAVSKSLMSDTMLHFGVKSPIVVVNNFVCFEKYEAARESECQKLKFAPGGEKILMHISNFRKVKRVQDIVKAFELVRQHEAVRLLLVGDGPERVEVERMVRDLGLAKDVVFVGELKDVELALCAADLFLLASESESFGLVALEAMAAGVPVVSTNTGGLPEVNIDGETGFTVEVGDVEAMSLKALEVLEKDNLKKFKERTLLHAKGFDVALIAPQYLDLYYSAINR